MGQVGQGHAVSVWVFTSFSVVWVKASLAGIFCQGEGGSSGSLRLYLCSDLHNALGIAINLVFSKVCPSMVSLPAQLMLKRYLCSYEFGKG